MSFRLKIILGIAAIEIVLLSILVISALYYLRLTNEDHFIRHGAMTARLAAALTREGAITLDLASLDALIQETLEDSEIVYARVRYHNGKVLSQGGDPEALKAPFVADHTVAGAVEDDQRFDIAAPITVAGREIGQMEIGLDTHRFSELMTRALRWMGVVAGLDVVLVALFGTILGRILTRQLASLQMGARKVAAGEFGYRIAVRGKDELADTAKSFNAMSAALDKYARAAEAARQQAEAGRARAESILADAVESLTQGVIIVDDQSRLLHTNRACAGLVPDVDAYVATMASGSPPPSGPPGEDDRSSATSLANPQTVTTEDGEHWTTRLEDGRYVLNSRRHMRSGGWVFVVTDVTPIYAARDRERQLELELLQSQKFEALGTLAGGIAHEINTPIQYIGNNLHFLGDSLASILAVIDVQATLVDAAADTGGFADQVAACRRTYADNDVDFLRDEALQATKEALDGVAQVSRIVLAMKEFSHPTSREKVPVDLNRIVERTSVVCRNEWKHVAEMVFELAPDLPEIAAHEGELNQVMLNLMVNAAHAIASKHEGKGTITLRTWVDSGTVRLRIEDTGIGIPEAIRDRIFDPFFTTKDVGKGTGQGLALCRDVIVNKHGGDVTVESEEGRGAVFEITLPLGTN